MSFSWLNSFLNSYVAHTGTNLEKPLIPVIHRQIIIVLTTIIRPSFLIWSFGMIYDMTLEQNCALASSRKCSSSTCRNILGNTYTKTCYQNQIIIFQFSKTLIRISSDFAVAYDYNYMFYLLVANPRISWEIFCWSYVTAFEFAAGWTA